MAEFDETLARYSVEAIRAAAEPLKVEPVTLAKRLQSGEIIRLLRLLNAALPHVATPGLRHRIEDLLSSVTDGRMPMFEKPETELDWALERLRSRRQEGADEEQDTDEE
jgi:hypothetical protein